MALLKKEPAADRMRAKLDGLRVRRTALVAQLRDSADASAARQHDLQSALISDAPETVITKAESALSDSERRHRALATALSALDSQIVELEAEITEYTHRKAAEAAADDLDLTHADFTAKLGEFIKAAEALEPIATRLGASIFTSKEIASLLRKLLVEIPTAASRLADEQNFAKHLILTKPPKQARITEHGV